MKWLIELAKDKELSKPARVMAMIAYGLWAAATALALFGWVWKFVNGDTTISELVEIITKLFM